MIIKYWDSTDKICRYATVRELCKQPHLEDKLKGLYPHLGGWAAERAFNHITDKYGLNEAIRLILPPNVDHYIDHANERVGIELMNLLHKEGFKLDHTITRVLETVTINPECFKYVIERSDLEEGQVITGDILMSLIVDARDLEQDREERGW